MNDLILVLEEEVAFRGAILFPKGKILSREDLRRLKALGATFRAQVSFKNDSGWDDLPVTILSPPDDGSPSFVPF